MIGFIGNENAISRVKNDLMLALVQAPPHLPKNYLFVGLPSTGKTELCRHIAAAVKLPFVRLDGHGVGDRERLFDLVDGQLVQDYGPGGGKVPLGVESGLAAVAYPPCVVMIDEVHLLSHPTQESLLTALEMTDRSMTLKQRVVHLENMTFLLATTRASELDKAFRSRCTMVELSPYSEQQVAQIVRARIAPRLEEHHLTPWPDEVYARLARLGQVVPRSALDLAKELQTEIEVSDARELTVDAHLDVVQRRMELDENGLGRVHIRYLRILQKNGVCGFGTMVGLLGTTDEDVIEYEIEPRLVALGLIEKTQKGRRITTDGLVYVSKSSQP
jgi:Holliday junction resolvasome RuvABC ATP-dependent DNA helicase subunit